MKHLIVFAVLLLSGAGGAGPSLDGQGAYAQLATWQSVILRKDIDFPDADNLFVHIRIFHP